MLSTVEDAASRYEGAKLPLPHRLVLRLDELLPLEGRVFVLVLGFLEVGSVEWVADRRHEGHLKLLRLELLPIDLLEEGVLEHVLRAASRGAEAAGWRADELAGDVLRLRSK